MVRVAMPRSRAAMLLSPLEEVERRVLHETLRHTGGDKSMAARRLGIATRTIYRKLERDGTRRDDDEPGEG